MKNTIVIASGYFNPTHTGHLDYLEEAKKLGDVLIVIVNNDDQVKVKGSKPFLSEKERGRLVQALGCVDFAVMSIDKDGSVTKTVQSIWNTWCLSNVEFVFANGGDQKSGVPEEEFCNHHGIKMVYGVGGEKTQSSSSLLNEVS